MPASLDTATELYRTATGRRLHIPGCPHVGSPLRPAAPVEIDELAVCEWCEAELAGVGRTYYANIDDAMRALGCWEGTQSLIRQALADIDHDRIWLPHSESYIALGLDGQGVAWVGKGYVFVKATAVYTELPGHRAGRGGGAPREVRYGDLCVRHNVVRSVAGTCDQCD